MAELYSSYIPAYIAVYNVDAALSFHCRRFLLVMIGLRAVDETSSSAALSLYAIRSDFNGRDANSSVVGRRQERIRIQMYNIPGGAKKSHSEIR